MMGRFSPHSCGVGSHLTVFAVWHIQAVYNGAEGVKFAEADTDLDPRGGEVAVDPLRAAEAHAAAQNTMEPLPSKAQQVALIKLLAFSFIHSLGGTTSIADLFER